MDNKPMTTEELAKLKRLTEAATPGPWGYHNLGDVFEEITEEGIQVARCSEDETLSVKQIESNSLFIVAARTAVPRLISSIEAKDREIGRLVLACQKWAERAKKAEAALELSKAAYNEICGYCNNKDAEIERLENALGIQEDGLEREWKDDEDAYYHGVSVGMEVQDIIIEPERLYQRIKFQDQEIARLQAEAAAIRKAIIAECSDHCEGYGSPGCREDINETCKIRSALDGEGGD